MSIHNLLYKIKGSGGIDRQTILFLFIVVCVGLGSFGLGRLSVTGQNTAPASVQIFDTALQDKAHSQPSSLPISDQQGTLPAESSHEGMYVASKHGKLYYTQNCSGAKRIAEKNQVWFATAIAAQEAGYTLSTSCK